MEGKIIQLPYDVIFEKNDPENELQFNFPPNFRKDILFDKLLFLTHSENPTLNNMLKMMWLTILSFKNIFWQLVYCKIAYNKVWT